MSRLPASRRRISRVGPWVFAAILGLVVVSNSKAQEASTGQEVTSEAVVSPSEILDRVPWYDVDQSELRSIPVRTRTDDSLNRDSRWLPQPEKVKQKSQATATPPPAATGGGGTTGGWFTMDSLWAWLLIGLIVVGLVVLLMFALSKTEFGTNESTRKSSDNPTAILPDEQLLKRIEELPAELRRTDVNPRSEAERLMQLGQFDQAIVLLFGHQLLLLDQHHLLRLTRGKTNGRYVRETQHTDSTCGGWLRETATAFERSYFGQHRLIASEFEHLWRQNARLENRVAAKQEAA